MIEIIPVLFHKCGPGVSRSYKSKLILKADTGQVEFNTVYSTEGNLMAAARRSTEELVRTTGQTVILKGLENVFEVAEKEEGFIPQEIWERKGD